MTTKTDVATEVEAIREASAKTTFKADWVMILHQALGELENATEFAEIELWARLAADLAGMLQRKEG